MRGICTCGRLFAILSGVSIALAHEDDAKGLFLQPPYWGPGYRAATADTGTASLNEDQALSGLAGQQTSGVGPNFPALNVELMSWLPLSEFNAGTTGNNCWGYTSPSGREYAIMGCRAGTGFVEVTDPANAHIVTIVPAPSSLWHDMKIYQHYCYVVTEATGGGIQIIDLAQIDNGVVTLVNTVNDGTTGKSHTIALDEVSGFLYRAGGNSNGLRIYSLTNPTSPTLVGQWQDRYCHEAQVVTYTSGPYAGRQIAFACTGFNGGSLETGLETLDVTNKASIQNLSRVVYQNGRYSHQGWLSNDRQYFFLGDELDEGFYDFRTKTLIWNVSNINNIQHVGNFSNNSFATGHNLYTKGRFIYAANYQSGLRIFDASNPLAPVEVAYFDVNAAADGPELNNAWGNYPFFASGTVLISDMQQGLFVVRPNLPQLPGDMNCDGVITVADVGPFVLALTNPAGYDAAFPDCEALNADLSGDGLVTVSDIGPFVALLTG